jgi:uncharacterized coiled-coil DUF342 family protein
MQQSATIDVDRDDQAGRQASDSERLRSQIRKLVLMKETGPKSAAWHRARVQTIWRLHRQLEAAEAAQSINGTDQAA